MPLRLMQYMKPSLILIMLLAGLVLSCKVREADEGTPANLKPVKANTIDFTVQDPSDSLTQAQIEKMGLAKIEVQTHMGYCDEAYPAILQDHGYSLQSVHGPGCPLKITFNGLAQHVEVAFAGCRGKYKLVGYDVLGREVAAGTAEVELRQRGTAIIGTSEPMIHSVTIARGSGCATYVKKIGFR